MEAIEKTLLVGILESDEEMLWIGQPLAKPFKIRNIARVIVDFVKISLIIFFSFSVYYIFLGKEFFPRGDSYSLLLFLLVFLVINVFSLFRRLNSVDKIWYGITARKVIIFNPSKRQKVKILDKKVIRKKKIIKSATDRRHNVQTLELQTDDDRVYLESVENSIQLLEII